MCIRDRFYVIPLLAGLAVGHAYIPPTPGPVLVATIVQDRALGALCQREGQRDQEDVYKRQSNS